MKLSTLDLSARLLGAVRREPQQHTMLRENVATYLAQLKPEFLDSLEQVPEDQLVRTVSCAYAQGKVEMVQKLSRDLGQKPYDDAAVLARLDALESELKSKVEATPYPSQFYICGSLIKGRFGANSDLDLLCQTSPEWGNKHYAHAFDDVSVQYFHKPDQAQVDHHVASFAPIRPLLPEELEEPGLLRRIYQEGIEKRGYRLEEGHLKATAPVILHELEVAPTGGSINWSAPMMC